ncbi:MAG: two-component system sensor histidine kinase NtrB [bacterium]
MSLLNYSDILNGISDGIIVIDENFRIIYANKAFVNNSDLSQDEIIDNYCYKVSHLRDEPCDPMLESCSIEEVIKKRNTVKVIHGHFGYKNKEIAVEISSAPFVDSNTGKVYAVEVVRQIGSGSSSETKFNLSQRLAKVAYLAEGVAHEINNPLNNILASIDIIRSCIAGNQELEHRLNNSEIIIEPGSCDIKKYFELMQNEIERCKSITQKMLLFSRPVSEPTDIIDVNNSINETVSLLMFLANQKNVMIKKNFAADLPVINFSDAGLRQVILNIGINAIQAVNENSGIVYFVTKKIKNYILIFIIDNGKGISIEDIKRIFDPFFSKNKNTDNSGLGLSISLSIIKSLGGSIDVRSKENIGTKFTIKVPYE